MLKESKAYIQNQKSINSIKIVMLLKYHKW